MNETCPSFARAVGRRIAAERRAAGLTQAQLAQRLGWPRDTLIHYEHGRRALTVARLAAIGAALAVPPAAFLADEDAAARLIRRLLDDPHLRQQVDFFLATLEEDA